MDPVHPPLQLVASLLAHSHLRLRHLDVLPKRVRNAQDRARFKQACKVLVRFDVDTALHGGYGGFHRHGHHLRSLGLLIRLGGVGLAASLVLLLHKHHALLPLLERLEGSHGLVRGRGRGGRPRTSRVHFRIIEAKVASAIFPRLIGSAEEDAEPSKAPPPGAATIGVMVVFSFVDVNLKRVRLALFLLLLLLFLFLLLRGVNGRVRGLLFGGLLRVRRPRART
jgi:hypothetical protein